MSERPIRSEVDDLFGTKSTDELGTEAQDDLNAAFAKCFSTKAGRMVLGYLRSYRQDAATWDAGLGLLNGIAYGFAREGQNALVREIENRVELGRQ